MKFNTIIKKSIAVSSLALLATACKPGLNNNEDAYLFAIASSQIRGLAEGNCAISINHAGLTYGAYVNVAINDGNVGGLNTALAGLNAATQGVFSAVAGGANVARFTQANFEAAIGSTVAELGYANYAAVPYNVKYDAFFTERGDWTADKRNALLNFSKTFMDSFSPWPILGINSDGTAFGAALNGLTGTAATIQDNVLNAASGGARANRGAFLGALPGSAGDAYVAGFVGIGNFVQINGTGALACARIPKQNCSVEGVTTPNRAAAITSATSILNTLYSNSACKRPSDLFTRALAEATFKGLPGSETVNSIALAYTPSKTTAGFSDSDYANSLNTIDARTKILPSNAYPSFGNLVSLGFGNIMPINKTSQPYNSTATEFTFGKNLEVQSVSSCESLGMIKGITVDRPEGSRQDLTSTVEIAYALSTGGNAAASYADVTAKFSTGADAPACNSDFRKRFDIPVALGGGRLPVLNNANSGNGLSTSLLSICVYGGDNSKRNYPRGLLAGGLGIGTDAAARAQIPACGEGTLESVRAAQQGAAALFNEVGTITEGSNFPNTTKPAN